MSAFCQIHQRACACDPGEACPRRPVTNWEVAVNAVLIWFGPVLILGLSFWLVAMPIIRAIHGQ